jgi:hypothetical protein
MSLFAARTFFPNMFAMIFLLGSISGLVYIVTIGQLVGQADKSVVLWVLPSACPSKKSRPRWLTPMSVKCKQLIRLTLLVKFRKLFGENGIEVFLSITPFVPSLSARWRKVRAPF